MALSESRRNELIRFAKEIRMNTLECLNHLGFGHYGGSLSVVEVLAVLYKEVMPMTSDEFALKLLEEEKVAVVPGTAFGDCGEGYLRISYAYSLNDLKRALERMERFVKRHLNDAK